MVNNEAAVVLITGANRGLGRETARQLGRRGLTVIIAARNAGDAEETATALRAEAIDAHPLVLDVSSEASIAQATAEVESRFGRLDVLVNNAAIVADGSLFGNRTSQLSMKALRDTFDTNFFGLIAVTLSLLPLLKKSPSARIVNVSSTLGSLSMQADPESIIAPLKPVAYAASKAAVNMFTVHLANELQGTAVRVNSAHPGWVKTRMGTDAAPMSIEDGAKTLVDLALPDADVPHGKFIHLGEIVPW